MMISPIVVAPPKPKSTQRQLAMRDQIRHFNRKAKKRAKKKGAG